MGFAASQAGFAAVPAIGVLLRCLTIPAHSLAVSPVR
jgi:hypothetical protein